jgi:hypothetical protein
MVGGNLLRRTRVLATGTTLGLLFAALAFAVNAAPRRGVRAAGDTVAA